MRGEVGDTLLIQSVFYMIKHPVAKAYLERIQVGGGFRSIGCQPPHMFDFLFYRLRDFFRYSAFAFRHRFSRLAAECYQKVFVIKPKYKTREDKGLFKLSSIFCVRPYVTFTTFSMLFLILVLARTILVTK